MFTHFLRLHAFAISYGIHQSAIAVDLCTGLSTALENNNLPRGNHSSNTDRPTDTVIMETLPSLFAQLNDPVMRYLYS